jgi:hypothetical protein
VTKSNEKKLLFLKIPIKTFWENKFTPFYIASFNCELFLKVSNTHKKEIRTKESRHYMSQSQKKCNVRRKK